MKPYGQKRAKNMCYCCTAYTKQKKIACKKRGRKKAKKEIEDEIPRDE
jgi:hypothetical protein